MNNMIARLRVIVLVGWLISHETGDSALPKRKGATLMGPIGKLELRGGGKHTLRDEASLPDPPAPFRLHAASFIGSVSSLSVDAL
eukprot:1763078-Rhodomonas_salina.2